MPDIWVGIVLYGAAMFGLGVLLMWGLTRK